MRKLIAAINTTLDGVSDHTAVSPDQEIHQHYSDLLKQADTILYGRITYQLMEYWPTVVANPTGNKATDDFARTIDRMEKVVFSHTLKELTWRNSRLVNRSLANEVDALKQQPGRDFLVGSPSLIIESLSLGLVDELQLCVHPVIAGAGTLLFKNIHDRIGLTLVKTKTFACGAIILYYEKL